MADTPKDYIIIGNTGEEINKVLKDGGDFYETKQELEKIKNHPDDTNIHISFEDRNKWNNKVDKVDGMGLSKNDFTDEYKEMLINGTIKELYVGSVEPSDPNIRFWINPDATPSTGESGGGGISGEFEDGNEVEY